MKVFNKPTNKDRILKDNPEFAAPMNPYYNIGELTPPSAGNAYGQLAGNADGQLPGISAKPSSPITPSAPTPAPTGWDAFYQQQIDYNKSRYEKELAYLEAENQKLLAQIEAKAARGDENAKKYYDYLVKQADSSIAKANRRADVAEEKGIVDARNAYAENLSTRGTQAERLADMGLAGSGYSDYLDSKAYATERGEIANVRGYADMMRNDAAEKAEDIKNKGELEYQRFLTDNDNWEADAKAEAQNNFDKSKYGIESQYEENLFGIEQNKKKQELLESEAQKNPGVYDEILNKNPDEYGVTHSEQVDSLVDSGKITEEQAQDLNYRHYMQNIEYATPQDAQQISADYKAGKLTSEQYNSLVGKYNALYNAPAEEQAQQAFFDKNGKTIAPSQAKKIYDAYYNDPLLSADKKAGFKAEYDKLYGITTYSESANVNADTSAGDTITEKFTGEGHNLIVKIDGKEYKVQSTGVETDADLIEASRDVKEHQLFKFRGDLYVKATGGEIIGLEGRYWNKKGYEELIEKTK